LKQLYDKEGNWPGGGARGLPSKMSSVRILWLPITFLVKSKHWFKAIIHKPNKALSPISSPVSRLVNATSSDLDQSTPHQQSSQHPCHRFKAFKAKSFKANRNLHLADFVKIC